MIDIAVEPAGLVSPDGGGLSVTPGDPQGLPRHRRPPEFGGTGKDPLWMIRVRELGPQLRYRPDPLAPSRHGSIEPVTTMALAVLQEELAGTRERWRPATDTRDLRESVERDEYLRGVARMRTGMQLDAQFDAALHAPEPLLRLRDTVSALLDQDWTRDELLAALETFRDTLRAAGRDADEDTVLEAMDFVTGWCSPQMKV